MKLVPVLDLVEITFFYSLITQKVGGSNLSRNQRNQFVRRNQHVDLVYQTFANPAQGNIGPQLTETMLLELAMSERLLSRQGRGLGQRD